MSAEIETLPTQVNPMVILDRMAASGVDPDKLGRVIDLVESWNAGRAKEAFAVAMNLCQQEMPLVIEDSENSHTRSRYASLEAVNRVCKPCYTRHGFSIQFSEGEAKNSEEIHIVADVLHAGGHERRYYIDLARDGVGIKGNSNMTPLQGKGSTFSYGQRYLVKLIFNLTIAGEDTDGQNGAGLTDEQTVILNELFEDVRGETPEEKWEKWKRAFWSWVNSFNPGATDLNGLHSKHFAKVKDYLESLKRKGAPK